MTRFVPKRSDWVLLVVAVLLNCWYMLPLLLHGYGTASFAAGYRKVHIGMSWQEWQTLEKQYGVECVCDATSCYVDDLLREYNVNFRKRDGEPLRIYAKRAYLHFQLKPYYW
jgi:hypothetical protein